MHSDHPSNSKRGGVWICYNGTLLQRIINVNYLNECIRFELDIGEKLCRFISLYRSSSQTLDKFDKFTDNLELNLELAVEKNPYLLVVLGDFNANAKNWYGCDKTTFEGNLLKSLFSQFGLHQMINKTTHMLILHILISFSHPHLIWLYSQAFTHPYIQIVIIRLFSQNLI